MSDDDLGDLLRENDRLRTALAEAERGFSNTKAAWETMREDRDRVQSRLAEAERERDTALTDRHDELQDYRTRAERAEADLAAAREVIEPFAVSSYDFNEGLVDRVTVFKTANFTICLGDLRRARAVLERTSAMSEMIEVADEDVAKLKARFGEQWRQAASGSIHGWLIRLEMAEARQQVPANLDLDAS